MKKYPHPRVRGEDQKQGPENARLGVSMLGNLRELGERKNEHQREGWGGGGWGGWLLRHGTAGSRSEEPSPKKGRHRKKKTVLHRFTKRGDQVKGLTI